MDWRSSTPPAVAQDIDSLTADSVEAAAQFLSKDTTFTPFMQTIGVGGEREFRNLGTPLTVSNEIAFVRALELPGDVEMLRARACVLDVVSREPIEGDAIMVKVEHRAGFCSDLLVPYALSDDALSVDMEHADAAVAEPLLWGRASISEPE